MKTSSIQPLQKIYRREIEVALKELGNLKKDSFYSVPKITWWILTYVELYKYSHDHRHVSSCIEGMGCSCSWDSPESKFSDLYSGLKEVVDLFQHEKYFREELSVLEKVRDDYTALMQWLKKNEKLGTEEFFLFWIEWYEGDNEIVKPFLMGWGDLEIKFKAEEWQNTIRFCEVFNELYWTSDACIKNENR